MSLLGTLKSISATVNSIKSTIDKGQNILNAFSGAINDFSNPARVASALRAGSMPTGTESAVKTYGTGEWRVTDTSDWRVRLLIPPLAGFGDSPILQPLYDSNYSMVWPTTPQITMGHSATYTQLSPVHTNYPFQMYQSSQPDDITINGAFPIDNESDGRYWIAAVHFLRSASKMYYGEQSSMRGAPPPVLRLNGYGDFVLKNIPVVIKSFTVELPNGVDYIRVPITGEVDTDVAQTTGNVAYVPALSSLSVTLAVTQSRDEMRQFSLDKFVKGDYITQGKFI
jgi:hypothetical protein